MAVKVSVLLVTCNHEPYVEQALRSVLEQRTAFEFEVIVSEDASTDRTLAIVEAWKARYPAQIRILSSTQNLRSNEVVTRGFRAARGEYVALLDGDDYWTSPEKLAVQAALLDASRELTLCFHDAEVVDADGRMLRAHYTAAQQKQRLTLDDLWQGNPFATCTAMFRRGAVEAIPAWFDGFFPVTDWPLYILFAERGGVGYLPTVMGAYRLHPGGLYSRRTAREKLASADAFYRRIDRCLEGRYARAIRKARNRYFLDWAAEHVSRGERELARESLWLSLAYGGPRSARAIVDTLKRACECFVPGRTRKAARGGRA